jgi:hypothetical protein
MVSVGLRSDEVPVIELIILTRPEYGLEQVSKSGLRGRFHGVQVVSGARLARE